MQTTLGQSIKLGFGLAVGWLIGSSIFNIITGIKIVQTIPCEKLHEMLSKTTDYNEREKIEKIIKESC